MRTTSALEPEAYSADIWKDRLANRTRRMTSSAIRELLKLTEDPAIISFAGGLPAPEVFPLEAVEAAAHRLLAEHGRAALQYSTTEGYLPLRELLVRHMKRYGVSVTPANIVVTAGSQQALDLVGKVLIDPGDKVGTEEPTYLGALQAFTAYEASFVSFPIDDDGLRLDGVEAAMQSGLKFLYVLPNFQNPAGTTLSLERREKLVALAARYATPIVEDDPYGQLRYEGYHLPPLFKLDAELRGNGGGVIYTGTLSKTLAPGLRLGWIAAPEAILQRLIQAKQGADLHTSTFAQMLAYETARAGFLDRHVRTIRRVYKERRDAMLAALDRHFPSSVTWTRPAGGLFLWVQLPSGLDSGALLKEAVAEKVAFVPGVSFFPRGDVTNTFRLNFSYCTPETIEDGIGRLGRVLKRRMAA